MTDIPKVICCDFDGTLCHFAYPDIGPIKPGAKEALLRFRELGYRIIIHSCRTCLWHPDIFGDKDEDLFDTANRRVVQAMEKWLNEHDIPYDEIDYGQKGKPTAQFYIDDKGVRFEDNWDEVVRFVEERT
jgi:hydroxymethylpyrimidine pyrophosphatase-like HAD family hydrolase